ncbi:MAG: LysR family transcriptional regulator [Rhizobiales bacterium]|nr:LysR family transcriptional regulator [Hyphomicrobiales bacterium]
MFIRQMTYLVALAREKHFGRAADVCNVTQPTLSSGLKALERELDMRLVVREPRFMGLTPEGERVVEWAGQILADYESLKQDVEVFRSGLRGTLRLGVIPAAMPPVARLTRPFSAKYPQVTIDVQSMTSAEIQRGLDRLEIDAGLTYLENEPLSHVRKAALYSERYLFVTGRAGPWAAASSIAWQDAANENLCLLNESMQNRRVLNNLAHSAGVELAPSVTTNSFLAVCSHVCTGAWSSIIPHTFAYIFAGCEDLVLIDLVEPVHSQTIGLVASDRDPLSPLARALLTCAGRLNLDAMLGGPVLELAS